MNNEQLANALCILVIIMAAWIGIQGVIMHLKNCKIQELRLRLQDAYKYNETSYHETLPESSRKKRLREKHESRLLQNRRSK